jgi:anaerobic selenocysteine-containing dehydrogenase
LRRFERAAKDGRTGDPHHGRLLAELEASSGASRKGKGGAVAPLLPEGEGKTEFPLSAITQRPMFMYHAWGSQNRWLRQIAARNVLYVHPRTLADHAIEDGDWVWIASERARIRVQARAHAATAPGTVWTWNAVGKKRGAWKLRSGAPEFTDGFLLNHLIGERARDDVRYANGDPITGQAAWFDLRVRLETDSEPRVPGHRIESAT